MDAIEHATLAHALISARGGVDAIVEARLCRARSTQLYAYQDPGSGQFMPADVMYDLERGGEPLYSQALFERNTDEGADPALTLLTAACEETEAAADLQREARRAAGHRGGPSPNERKRLCAQAHRLMRGALRVIDSCSPVRS